MLKSCMANLQIKNISEALHRELRETAAENRTTISNIVLEAIEHELARRRWQSMFAGRTHSDLGMAAAELLKEERAIREG